jgi:hypothetical protein
MMLDEGGKDVTALFDSSTRESEPMDLAELGVGRLHQELNGSLGNRKSEIPGGETTLAEDTPSGWNKEDLFHVIDRSQTRHTTIKMKTIPHQREKSDLKNTEHFLLRGFPAQGSQKRPQQFEDTLVHLPLGDHGIHELGKITAVACFENILTQGRKKLDPVALINPGQGPFLLFEELDLHMTKKIETIAKPFSASSCSLGNPLEFALLQGKKGHDSVRLAIVE